MRPLSQPAQQISISLTENRTGIQNAAYGNIHMYTSKTDLVRPATSYNEYINTSTWQRFTWIAQDDIENKRMISLPRSALKKSF